ncbi:hypothetical protein HY524_01960 [Candidatus Berkelbacteria bacterium]|nr:hypothetical protein [Candidatus Berkelbacteria bacterium]
MVDTVLLTLPAGTFEVADHAYNRFTPSARNFFYVPYPVFGRNCTLVKAVCNPTTEDKKLGYFPYLTLCRAVRQGGIVTYLQVRFSAPKLLYLNNVDELTEADFEAVCEKLSMRLAYFGIRVHSLDVLRNAIVSSIHYGKNIPLTDYSVPSMYLHQLSKVNASAWYDLNQVDYRNGGYALKLHTKSWELCLYDKRKDHEQAKKSDERTISRDNSMQLTLFDDRPIQRPFELLRIEARYNSRPRIKTLLRTLGKEATDLTFARLFSADIARRALLDEVSRLRSIYPTMASVPKQSAIELLTDLRISSPGSTFRQRMLALAYHTVLTEIGPRELRTIGIEKPSEWHKFQQSMKPLKVGSQLPDPFALLERSIKDDGPFKLIAYEKA